MIVPPSSRDQVDEAIVPTCRPWSTKEPDHHDHDLVHHRCSYWSTYDPLVQTTAAAYAAERHYSPEWQRWVCRMLRLALAIRDADGDDLVREEALDDLPHFADAAAEVLRRTGLLRPRPAHRPAATPPAAPGP